jgi:hypothetical protein
MAINLIYSNQLLHCDQVCAESMGLGRNVKCGYLPSVVYYCREVGGEDKGPRRTGNGPKVISRLALGAEEERHPSLHLLLALLSG